MKFLIFTLTVLFLLPTTVFANEPIYPQGDFDLVQGAYRILNPEDPAPLDKSLRSIFGTLEIPVRNGAFSTTQSVTIGFYLSAQHFFGTDTFHIEGTYDKDNGKLNGTYRITYAEGSNHYTDGKITGNTRYEANESGSFQGRVSGDYVVMTFFCKSASGEAYSKFHRSEEITTVSKCAYAFYRTAFRIVPPPPPVLTTSPVATTTGSTGDSNARAAGLRGQVEILLPGATEWRLMKLETVIPNGAHIRTDEDSSIILSFSDMSTFVLKAESEVIIDSPPERDSKIKLVAGNIWANIKKMAKDGTMEVEMNQAVAGIKGTTFACEEKNGKSTLMVIDGTVDLKAQKTGQTVQVKSGEKVEADSNGLGQIVKFDTAEEIESWIKLNEPDWSKLDNEEAPLQPQSNVDKRQPEEKPAQRTLLIVGGIAVMLSVVFGFIFFKK